MTNNLFFYSDESSQQSRHMLLGGLAVKESNVATVEAALTSFREEFGEGELKWSKLANHKYAMYKAFVDIALELIEEGKMSYHSAVFDNQRVNHRRYSGGNERGFFTLYKHFLVNGVGRRYMKTCNIHVRLDRLTSKYPVHDLKFSANNVLQFGSEKYDRRPFRSTEYRDSEKEDLIQLADVITGALAFRKNKLNKPDARWSKVELSDYIIKTSGVPKGITSTPYADNWFTIFEMNLLSPI